METTVKVIGKMENCWKCNGTGNIPEFSHIAKGCCFACAGNGTLLAGRPVHAKDSLTCGFIVDGYVWEFEPITKGKNSNYVAKKGQQVDYVILQSYKAGSQRRNGKTILRCAVAPEIARKVFRDAKAGMKPEEMTNAYLGGFVDGYGRDIGPDFQTGSCALTRNGRGVSQML